jgi:site-specific DNA recombinase
MNNNPSVFRVALYARVSSDHQAEAGTIESQLADLRQQIDHEGFVLHEQDCFLDDGVSGTTLLRPGLERLRDQIANGVIDRLYVHSPDRLARKHAYQVLLIEEFQRAGVDVRFLNRPLGQSPEDDLLLQVQGIIAEYERTKIVERSRRGKLHAARQGSVTVLAGAPYGYRYVTIQEGGGVARYDVVLEEARVVRQVFAWVGQERLSLGEVRRRLAREKVPTRTGKAFWSTSAIAYILKNLAYKGQAGFGKRRSVERRTPLRPRRGATATPQRPCSVVGNGDRAISIPVPALVSVELFEQVAEQLAENRARARRCPQGVRHLLQGLLVCTHCGYALCGQPRYDAQGRRYSYSYYRCSASLAVRPEGMPRCVNRPCRSDVVEAAVWEDVCAVLRHPEKVEAEYQRRLEGTADATAASRCRVAVGSHRSTEAWHQPSDRRVWGGIDRKGGVRAEGTGGACASGRVGSRGGTGACGGGGASGPAVGDRLPGGVREPGAGGAGGGGLGQTASDHPGVGEADRGRHGGDPDRLPDRSHPFC